jgi:archaellin
MNAIMGFLTKLLRVLNTQEKGFTAIQTAIGVISSVAVAGTLGTAVVNSGTNAADQTEQVVQEAITNILGTYDLRGSVIGIASKTGADGSLGQLTFSIALVSSSGSIDFTPPSPSPDNSGLAGPDSKNTIIISYADDNQYVENLYWTINKLGNDNGDNILEGREMYQITIGGSRIAGEKGGNLVDALNPDLSTYDKFSIDIKSPQSPILVLERTTPAYIHNIVKFGY